MHDFSSLVGIISRQHEESVDEKIILRISRADAGSNTESVGEAGRNTELLTAA